MKILALDPGSSQSGWAIVDEKMRVLKHGITANHDVIRLIRESVADVDKIATEMISSQGMAVGKSVFDTCVWIGRFMQAWRAPDDVIVIFRYQVKMHLCNSTRAKDANIRQAIIDLYEPTGGGSVPQIGNKANPGPLFGVSSHVWPAIGVAIVAHHQSKTLKLPDQIPLYQANGEETEAPFIAAINAVYGDKYHEAQPPSPKKEGE